MVSFPALIGGTPLPADWVPSILFASLYALLLPVTIYRMVHRRSRTILLVGTAIFATERIVFFSLRAVQAHRESWRISRGQAAYLQSSLGLGYIGIASDLLNLLRALLVNSTYGPETYFQSPAAKTKDYVIEPPTESTPDNPQRRTNIRTGLGLLSLAFLSATIPGIVANAKYSSAIHDQSQADSTARLRIVSSAVLPALGCVILAFVSWGMRLPRTSKRGLKMVAVIILLMMTVAIYRLTIMHYKMTSLLSPTPLNKGTAKAAFYIFHIVPELIASGILLVFNTRKTFGTGALGDYRATDETEKQRRKREAKEAKRERRRLGNLNDSTANDTIGLVPVRGAGKEQSGARV